MILSGVAGAHAASAAGCPADTRSFDYSGLLVCWPNNDATVDITLYQSLGLTISQKWIGSGPVSGQAFDIASQRNKIWPSGGTSVDVDFVPLGHWKATLGGSSRLVDLQGRIMLQQIDYETADSFTVTTDDDGTLAFKRVGAGVFAAARPIPWYETPSGTFEYRVRMSAGSVDYVMRCLVEEDPGWFPIGCRAIWLTDRYAMVGTMTGDSVDAAMNVYENMRQTILGYLVRPKLTLP